MTKTINQITQNSAVLTYLRSNRRQKFTTKQITAAVNVRFKSNFTTTQMSKCLSRFCEKNVILSKKDTNIKSILWYSK